MFILPRINVLVRASTGQVRVFSLDWEWNEPAITAIRLIAQQDSHLPLLDFILYVPSPGTSVATPDSPQTLEWTQSFADDLQRILKDQCRSVLGYAPIPPSQQFHIHLFVVCKLTRPELEHPYQLVYSPALIDVKLLTINLISFKSWCKADLTRNSIQLTKPFGEIAKLMNQLNRKRNIVRKPGLDACFDCLGSFDLFSIVNPTESKDDSEDDGDDNGDGAGNVNVESNVIEVNEVESRVNAKSEGKSEGQGQGDDNDDKEILQFGTAGYGEFLAYFTVATNSAQRVTMRLMAKDHKRGSSRAEGAFVGPVIAPPCYYSELSYKYKTRLHGTQFQQNLYWAFPLFCSRRPKPGSSENLLVKYIPRSDFSLVTTPHFFPLIIGEVQSMKNQSDRWQMLLQGAVVARLMKQILGKSFVVIAIYIDLAGLASVYFMCQSDAPSNNTVSYTCVKYNFQDKRETLKCMRLLYNYVETLEQTVNSLESNADKVLVQLHEEADRLQSLASAKITSTKETPDAASTLDPTKSQKRARRSYEDQEILDKLVSNNVIVSGGKLAFPHIAFGVKCDIASGVKKEYGVAIKIVNRDSDEQSILQFLSRKQGLEGSQYVIPLQDIWFVHDAAILVMPFCDKKIKHYFTLEPNVLYSFALQIVKGLHFLHQNSIAHLDIKPDNILIQSHNMRLVIVDFSVSERLTSKSEFCGFVGTKSWAAPEVDSGSRFNMLQADLWSCGKVIEYLYLNSRSRPVAIRKIFKSLLDLDPDARPTLDKVLIDLQNLRIQNEAAT